MFLLTQITVMSPEVHSDNHIKSEKAQTKVKLFISFDFIVHHKNEREKTKEPNKNGTKHIIHMGANQGGLSEKWLSFNYRQHKFI